MISRLRGEAFARLEFYISQILEKEYANSEEEVKRVFNNQAAYFDLLRQSFGDLDEARTAELRLLELTQKGSVPEYLTKFTQFAARVAWDERAKMAQFYKGLSKSIKNAMAIQEFPLTWADLIQMTTRLDDNFRRRS
jgi:Retrotransposon gag protein